MPGQVERDRHDDSNVIPFPGRDFADNLPPTPRLIDPTVAQSLVHLRNQRHYAEECFPPASARKKDREPKVMLHGVPISFSPASEYFDGHVKPEELEQFLNPGKWNEWRYESDALESVYSQSWQTVSRSMEQGLRPINFVINRVLDKSFPDGFNKHGEEHTQAVVNQGIILLDYIGADEESKRDLVIASQGHDIGNLFGREVHPYISSKMLQRIMPQVKEDPEHWKRINTAILMHDSQNLHAVTSLWNGEKPEDKFTRLYEFLGPAGLALLIADKVDVGILRVSDSILASNTVYDPHAVVNALVKHDGLELERAGDSLVWNLQYDPEFTPQQMKKYMHFLPGWRRRLREGEVNISRERWEQMFWAIYADRVQTAVEASLTLFPFLEDFRIRITDDKNAEETVFVRGNLHDDFNNLRLAQQQYRKAGVLKYRK